MIFDEPELDYNSSTISHIGDSKYYSPLEYANILKDENSLKIIHMNVRYLIKNKNKIESLVWNMPIPPDIIAITETKLNSSIAHLVDITNYYFIHLETKSNAGGVVMYIKKELACLQRPEISIEN